MMKAKHMTAERLAELLALALDSYFTPGDEQRGAYHDVANLIVTASEQTRDKGEIAYLVALLDSWHGRFEVTPPDFNVKLK